MAWCGDQAKSQADLVIDDAPGVRNHGIVLPSKGMVASARCCKGVAHHLSMALHVVQQMPADVKGGESG